MLIRCLGSCVNARGRRIPRHTQKRYKWIAQHMKDNIKANILETYLTGSQAANFSQPAGRHKHVRQDPGLTAR